MENSRKSRGFQIAQTKTIQEGIDGWVVPSQSSNKKYFVRKDAEMTCNCPDCRSRGVRCKHAYAVEYYLQKITRNKDGSVQIEHKRLTYPQAWGAYNKSQQVEKEYFLKLLKDLTAIEQEKNFGRPKANLGEMAFCCALKVYSQFSTRRANTDIKEAFEKKLINRPHHYNTIIKYFDNKELTPLIKELIAVSAAPLKAVETSFAIDSTGLRTTKFNEYCKDKHDTKRKHEYIKLHFCTGTKTNIVTSAEITDENSNDCPQFAPLIQTTASNGFGISEVSADKAYSSRENFSLVSELGGTAYIPFKSNASTRSSKSLIWRKMFHYFQYNQEEFMQHYHKRSNAETTVSMIKAKFNDLIKNKKPTAQQNEALLKVLCHNIVVVVHEMHELGIAPDFCTQSLLPAHKEAI